MGFVNHILLNFLQEFYGIWVKGGGWGWRLPFLGQDVKDPLSCKQDPYHHLEQVGEESRNTTSCEPGFIFLDHCVFHCRLCDAFSAFDHLVTLGVGVGLLDPYFDYLCPLLLLVNGPYFPPSVPLFFRLEMLFDFGLYCGVVLSGSGFGQFLLELFPLCLIGLLVPSELPPKFPASEFDIYQWDPKGISDVQLLHKVPYLPGPYPLSGFAPAS